MIQLHVSGRLVCDPAQKTSANGKDYVGLELEKLSPGATSKLANISR